MNDIENSQITIIGEKDQNFTPDCSDFEEDEKYLTGDEESLPSTQEDDVNVYEIQKLTINEFVNETTDENQNDQENTKNPGNDEKQNDDESVFIDESFSINHASDDDEDIENVSEYTEELSRLGFRLDNNHNITPTGSEELLSAFDFYKRIRIQIFKVGLVSNFNLDFFEVMLTDISQELEDITAITSSVNQCYVKVLCCLYFCFQKIQYSLKEKSTIKSLVNELISYKEKTTSNDKSRILISRMLNILETKFLMVFNQRDGNYIYHSSCLAYGLFVDGNDGVINQERLKTFTKYLPTLSLRQMLFFIYSLYGLVSKQPKGIEKWISDSKQEPTVDKVIEMYDYYYNSLVFEKEGDLQINVKNVSKFIQDFKHNSNTSLSKRIYNCYTRVNLQNNNDRDDEEGHVNQPGQEEGTPNRRKGSPNYSLRSSSGKKK